MGFGAFVSSLFALNPEGQGNSNSSNAEEVVEDTEKITQAVISDEEKKAGTRMQFAMREARKIERSIYTLISNDKSLTVPFEEFFTSTEKVYTEEEIAAIEKGSDFRKLVQLYTDREQAVTYLFVDGRADGAKRVYVQFRFSENDTEVGQFSSDMPVNSPEVLKLFEPGEVVFGKICVKKADNNDLTSIRQ